MTKMMEGSNGRARNDETSGQAGCLYHPPSAIKCDGGVTVCVHANQCCHR